MIIPECQSPIPSNRHYRSNDDCLEGKRENYQVYAVQYCVQQLCIVQCTYIWRDLTVVCWLDLAFLWLYCVLHFICVRFSFLGLLCVRPTVYLLCMCFCCVRFSFFSTMWRDWLGRMSPKWHIWCRVGHITLTQSVYLSTHTDTQPFYGPFSGTTQVSRCQKRISGLYGARED